MKKQCTKCGRQKSFSEFYKHPAGKSGLHSRCKDCSKDYARKYRQTEIGQDYQREYQRIHRLKRSKYNKEYRKTFMGHLRNRFHLMKNRCVNPKCPRYKDYGGRGIKCLFETANEFIDYVLNVLKVDPRGLQIDRIDNNGHYEKGNIRFVTVKVNSNNRKR